MDNAGLDGAIYMNLYGGVKYINDLFYALPDTHCTKPIKIAKGLKTKNELNCGSKYQQSLLKSKKSRTRRTAEKTFCAKPPVAPQETYYECRYDEGQCVSSALAEAAAQSALVGTILGAILMVIATSVMGFPVKKKDPNLTFWQKLFPTDPLHETTIKKLYKDSPPGIGKVAPAPEGGRIEVEQNKKANAEDFTGREDVEAI